MNKKITEIIRNTLIKNNWGLYFKGKPLMEMPVNGEVEKKVEELKEKAEEKIEEKKEEVKEEVEKVEEKIEDNVEKVEEKVDELKKIKIKDIIK